MCTWGEPGIFYHVTMAYIVIEIGPEFLEQKVNVLCVVQPIMRSTVGVYDIRPPPPPPP